MARQWPIARGWQRQLDIERNKLFYGGVLNDLTYATWLSENGVRYVALPDAPLDSSSRKEKELIEREPALPRAALVVRALEGVRGDAAAPAPDRGRRRGHPADQPALGRVHARRARAGRGAGARRLDALLGAALGLRRARRPLDARDRGQAGAAAGDGARSRPERLVDSGPELRLAGGVEPALSSPQWLVRGTGAAVGFPTAGSTRSGSSCCSPAPTTRTGSSAAWSTARRASAFENARDIISAERSLNLFFEQDFQEWALANARWIVDGANWMYVNSHFVLTVGFLIWLYLARNEAYYFVRNMFMVAMGLALVGYVVYPTAPPRFMPEWGFQDTVTEWVGAAGRP